MAGAAQRDCASHGASGSPSRLGHSRWTRGVWGNPDRGAFARERAITVFAASSNGGLIITGSTAATTHRELIIALAARHRLPAIYYERYYAVAGGLISYGPDTVDECRRAAGYVDRILKGEKPA